MIVVTEIDAVTFASTCNTRLLPPALTVTPAFGPVIVSFSLVLLSSSWLPVRVIVCGVAKTCVSKVMVEIPEESRLAQAMASGRLKRPAPGMSTSLVVFTIKWVKIGPALVRAKEGEGGPVADATTV